LTGAKSVIPAERIENHILMLRGHKVILSVHLANLYGVQTRELVQAVKRNRDRFPEDFMFQLSWDEVEHLRSQPVILEQANGKSLRSQIVTLKRGQHMKYLPYAFTEQGVAMLSSVLRSKRAVQVNIEIMRAFVKLRQLLITHVDLARKLANLEKNYDTQFRVVFDAIRQLMTPPEPKKRRIGFEGKEK